MTTTFTSYFNFKKLLGIALFIFLSIQNGTSQSMDIFIKWPNVNGSSTIKTPDGSKLIEVLSYSVGAANNVTINSTSAGAGVGKTTESQLSFTLKDVTAVIALKTLLQKGTSSNPVWFIFNKIPSTNTSQAINSTNDLYLIGLTNCFINEIEESGASGNPLTFSVSLSYTAITYVSRPLKADGTTGTAVTTTWDFSKNVLGTALSVPSGY